MTSIAFRPIDLLLGFGKKGSTTSMGGNRLNCIEEGICTKCDGLVNKASLSILEMKEFNISGWCKSCQYGFYRSDKQEALNQSIKSVGKSHKIYTNIPSAQQEDAEQLNLEKHPNVYKDSRELASEYFHDKSVSCTIPRQVDEREEMLKIISALTSGEIYSRSR
jgi:hypothetical protein